MASIDNGLLVQNLTHALLKLTGDIKVSLFMPAPKNSASAALLKYVSAKTGRRSN
ncbi:MAG TPA: hypothetical protein VN249_05780 [Prolixibacteraceae bacterium]|nr:hypothetical protein [Prolixibacteraceae bacterium]